MTKQINGNLLLIFLSLFIFFLFLNYGIIRSTVDSLFLDSESSHALPNAWIFTGILMAFITSIYNKVNTYYPILKILGFSLLISVFFLTIILLGLTYNFHKSAYILYIWKETHIVLLVEIFWSFSNNIFTTKKAKYFYGILMLIGSLGGITGSIIISLFATKIGTINSLLLTIPLFVICFFLTLIINNLTNNHILHKNKKIKDSLFECFKTVINSKYLFPLLIIVLLAQISITLIDYHYNTFLQNIYQNIDERTTLMGKIHVFLDFSSIILQSITSSAFKYIGVTTTFTLIPLFASGLVSLFLIIPHFFFIIILRIGSKSLDYSLFKASKEIFYIPLDANEKNQGKAVIDILSYRLGKAFSSLLLILFISINAIQYTVPLILLLQFFWLLFTLIIAKRYKL